MNRSAFDAGISHLCDSLAARLPDQRILDAWYGHMREIPGPKWTEIVRQLVRTQERLPANLPRVASEFSSDVFARPDPPPAVPVNPDTGFPYTTEECYANLCRLEQLKALVQPDHPSRTAVIACALGAERDGNNRKWGAHIVDLLDNDIASPRVCRAPREAA